MKYLSMLTLLAAVAISFNAGAADTSTKPSTTNTTSKPNTTGRGQGKGMQHEGPLAKIIEHAQELGLSDDQIKKLEEIQAELKADRQKAMQDPAMRETMKEMMEARKAGDKAKLEELHKQMAEKMKPQLMDLKAKLAGILTQEQLQKVGEMMQRRNENPMDAPRQKGEGHQKPNSDMPAPKVFKDDAPAPVLDGQKTNEGA